MNKLLSKILVFIVVFFSGVANAEETETVVQARSTAAAQNQTNAAEKRVLQLIDKLSTYQAQFKQQVFDSRRRLVNENTGLFSLARPNRFRWHVQTPYEELIIANGQELWAIDFDLEQVTVQTISNSIGDTPALLLSRVDAKVADEFDVKYIGTDQDGRETYKLLPKDSSSLFESMTLVFVKDELKEIWLRDSLGQTTMVFFEQQKVNQTMPDALFVYQRDPNMDFIDSREQSPDATN